MPEACRILVAVKGGPGSGNWGHAGRPGLVGGSGGVSKSIPTSSAFGEKVLRDLDKKDAGSVRRAVKHLPQEHLDTVVSVEAGYRSSSTAGDCQALSQGSAIRLYSGTTGGRNWRKGTIVHEIGHAVLNWDRKFGGRRITTRVRALYSDAAGRIGGRQAARRAYRSSPSNAPKRGFPSGYSQVDANEFFAEGYQMYTSSPKTLQRRAPDLYNVMRDYVFDGVEYIKG